MTEAITVPAGYDQAREAFVAAARHAGASLSRVEHPELGIDGEPLSLDIAEVGPQDAEAALVIVSGTHGIEGYAGSSVQTHWLSTLAEPQADRVATVFVHALNPYGFSWARRVDERNVDLNRHFVDWQAPRPRNTGYDAIASALVPTGWDAESQAASGERLMAHLAQVGGEQFHRDIAGGQYDHPDGLFYGGARPGWAHRAFADLCRDRLSGFRRVACLDLHTGLGTRGQAQVILTQPKGDAGRARARDWWGEALAIMDADSAESDVQGPWTTYMTKLLPEAEVTAIALEWGTVDSLTVLDAVRADAWLHAHGDPRSERGDAIRRQMRAAFLVDEPDWLQGVWASFATAVEVGHAGLSAP